MRPYDRLSSLTAAFAAAAVLAVTTSPGAAADATPQAAAVCNDDKRGAQTPHARFAALPAPAAEIFDITDKKAALESVQYALSSIGDGASYVWHRGHGKLSGVIQPTQSFKDADGNICRHFVVMLASGTYTKRTETVACRLPNGIWQLDG
jgi:surface antigen